MLWNKVDIKIPSSAQFSDDEFFDLCQQNPDVKFERDQFGNITIMSPTGSDTGCKNTELTTELNLWNRKSKYGKVFDSSTGFKLPNGATRSPDASCIALSRWNTLSITQKKKFAPICPDFIIELMSESDDLKDSQNKMQEWMDNGCRLGWLIDPESEQVFIYSSNQAPELKKGFEQKLSGEDVLKGFEFDLKLLRTS